MGKSEREGGVSNDRFLEAAFEEFVKRGFAKTGMREVIRKSGGSFSTIYKRFGSKEGLFAAAFEHQTKKMTLEFERVAEQMQEAPIEECLNAFALKIIDAIFDEKAMLMHRLIVTEGFKSDAKLGRIVMEIAIKGHISTLAAYIKKQQQKGALREGDPFVAAARFIGCVKEPRHIHAIVTGRREAIDSAQRKAIAKEAARFFLYGFSA
ncbi:MAG: TetR/AcrR family transcriptional regulator [Helicobacteraceae bacterium]|nr:TetR/AcrR family transcriptional regulator [Helicobacteraceae bacterium]